MEDVLKSINCALCVLPDHMDTPEARVMLIAIGLQESAFQHRRQIKGPARGFWQFELGGGFRGVLRHASSTKYAKHLLTERRYSGMTESEQFAQLETDDVLAAGMARLLLWTDPKALPALNRPDDAFEYYLRTWRPGAHTRGTAEQRAAIRSRWLSNYAQAMAEVGI